MKTVSIDASAAASWILPSQRTERARRFLAEADYSRLIAPDVFAWEIGNLIARRVRRSRVERDRGLAILGMLNIEIAESKPWGAVLEAVEPAASRGLSLFDNAYLDQCLETGAALASRDRRLIEAARVAGIEVFDLRDPEPFA